MRPLPFALSAALLLAPSLAAADEAALTVDATTADDHDRVLVVAPPAVKAPFLDLGLHVVGAGYLATTGKHVAVAASAGLYQPWTVTASVGDVRGGYVRLRPFVYFTGTAPRGLWVSPFVQGGFVRGPSGEDGVHLGAGAAIGGSFTVGPLFLSLGGGGQYHRVNAPPPRGGRDGRFSQLGVHLDALVGFTL